MNIFSGKTMIITGGASGIGRELARRTAQQGARVVLADVNVALLEETVRSLVDSGCKAEAAPLDVTDFKAVKKLVDDTVAAHDRLDYIFNNAGIVVACEAQDHPYDEWHRVIDTNLFGVINGVAAAYPVMVRQGFGHIVNTASAAGLAPSPGEISYTTSKYAVVGLSNALRIEGAMYGVKVGVICPGFVRTPIYDSARTVNLDRDKLLRTLPKGMEVESGVETILRGVERNKAVILVSGTAKALWFLQRLSPALVRALLAMMMKSIHAARVADEKNLAITRK